MTTEISNQDDVIDSRDVIARIEELQELRDALTEAQEELKTAQDDGDEDDAIAAELRVAEAEVDFDEDVASELLTLESLAEEGDGYAPDWIHGTTLIRESYFTEYCEEMLKDIGDLPKDIPSYIEIDWEKTADNLRVDYTSIEFGDVTYLVR